MATLRVHRGEDLPLLHTFTDPSSLEGCTVWFTAKKYARQSDDEAVIRHFWTEAAEEGMSLTDPRPPGTTSDIGDGILYHTITAEETLELEPWGYRYDVKLETISGERVILEKGTLLIVQPVTQRLTTP